MVLLLVVILCLLLVLLSAKDATSTSNTAITGAIAGAGSFVPPNFTEWANDVVSKVNQTLPNFNQWANDVVSKVNQALPDFNQWANGVAQNTAQLLQNSSNFTEINEQILQTTRDSAQKLINIVKTLSNLEDTSTSIAGVVDDILLKALELLALHNDSTALPTSCKEIKKRQPLSPSGVYLLANTITAYCNMEELCGSGGGWTRLAYLNTTDPTENCPSGFRLYQSGGVRACGRATSILSFIGNDYFCESGNPATSDTWQSILYGTDPLWDGEGCGSLEGNCCNATGIPWFNKVLGTTTTDYLELRVCGDEGTANEDAPVSFYELYVK
ncbi:PREDICTED: uncharacterized protein LOC109590981 [Amphimedon queenslandica]|uniref:Fibrinogen C-terminal domain-containing protein n=1 Tax=Amphimedon queenslandica TaxID=400682 RepID=A0AAN0JZL4_AMPQE|nr:PREDICTED: uncharacterized protein LOC109590981 [Amphimedon queenslandica]|eukprot:XP_019862364.1 PREDICTED: uncharacterized protein LOC109590981 [Amphimedon queenslandica]